MVSSAEGEIGELLVRIVLRRKNAFDCCGSEGILFAYLQWGDFSITKERSRACFVNDDGMIFLLDM